MLALTGLILIVELWQADRPNVAGLVAAAIAAVTVPAPWWSFPGHRVTADVSLLGNLASSHLPVWR